jgi:hypothetical protein
MSLKNLLYTTAISCFLLFLLTSCTDSTGTEKGTLRGYVVLAEEDVIDHSEITVALYNKVALDTTIVRLNQEYPHIGVHISQETEFDHRQYSPVLSTISDANGFFEIKNIPAGLYNVVFSRKEWGFLYRYDINITGSTYDISDETDPLQLYPEVIVDSHIFDEFVCEPHRHYIFPDETVFHPSSHLIIQPESFLRINPAISISIYGTLTVESEPGQYFRVTSNDGFFEDRQEISNYAHLSIKAETTLINSMISSGIFTFGNYTLVVNVSGAIVTNSILSGDYSGCSFNQCANVVLRKSNFYNTLVDSQAALYLDYVDNSLFESLIFLNNDIGISNKSGLNNKILNSYFSGNRSIGILNWYDSDLSVLHSVFSEGNVGIDNRARSYIDFKYSFFNTEVGFVNNRAGFQWAFPTLNYNNFYCSNYAVRTIANFSIGDGIRYFVATYNYWGTTERDEIEALIWDRNDESENHPDYDYRLGVYVYEPFSLQKHHNAGIQQLD